MKFQWIPGQGMNRAAIERMKKQFGKPANDPPEAWFISEKQRYFHGLPEALDTNLSYVEEFLHDVGGGIKIFGRLDEWVDWFHYLLPYLLEHILEGKVIDLTMCYFINLYPDRIFQEYPGFREEVLLTLPKAIMESAAWDGQDFAKEMNYWFDSFEDYWPSPLYATMFFCLKYLKPVEIPFWVASIAAIQGSRWQNDITAWLRGAKRFLYLVQNPQEAPEPNDRRLIEDKDNIENLLQVANIDWFHSYLVFTGTHSSKVLVDYWSDENITTFWNEVKKYSWLSVDETS